MSFVLSVIHSQIVATTSITTECRKKRTRNNPLQERTSAKDRVRRRRRTSTYSNGIMTGGDHGVTRRRTTTTTTDRQRNVNWDSPIKVHFDSGHHQSSLPTITTTTKTTVTEEAVVVLQTSHRSSPTKALSTLRRRTRGQMGKGGEDDGFESLNGKSSSGDESHLGEQLRTTGDEGSLASDLPLDEEVVEDKQEVPGEEQEEQEQPKIKTRMTNSSTKGGKGDQSDTDEEREDEMDLNLSSPGGRNSSGAFTEGTNSNGEWCGVTTNSDECSYSSDLEHTDSQDFAPTVILNSNCGAMDRSE